jgi:predicted GNAT family acetyltransferase
MRWTSKIDPDITTGGLRRLTLHDVPAIRDLYARAMPKAHFDPRMVELGKTFGWVEGNALLSIATCHVFSQEYAVAAIGAVATCPTCRRRGLATAVTWALTRDVARDVAVVALNVHSQNQTAIGIYERLGYRQCHRYEEALVTAVSS